VKYKNKFLIINDEHVGGLKGMFLESGDDEDYKGCRFMIYTGKHSIRFNLPRIIKPKKHLHVFKQTWIEGSPESSYWEYFNKQYGWTFLDNHFSILYGFQTDRWSSDDFEGTNSKRWSCFLPWNEWVFAKHTIYNLDGSIFASADHTHVDFDERENVPTRKFAFKDYDGEEIEATCYTEERVWTKGDKMFKWLRFIIRDKIRKSIDISFSKEVGSRKGSWKGGTLGHGIDIIEGEDMVDTFKRYCIQENLTFVEEIFDV